MPLTRLFSKQARACSAVFAAVSVALCLIVLPALGQGAETGRSTGLPLPRFVSLSADLVNLRTGPGLRYPIEWVYQRRDLPVEVIDEFESWRRLRDWEGTVGWVHAAMLQGKRTARITGEQPRLLRTDPNPDAEPVALLEPGTIGTLDTCRNNWCRLHMGGYRGWLQRDQFFGAYPGETLR